MHQTNDTNVHFTAHNTLDTRADDDLDAQIAEAAAAQSAYDEWKAQLAADCHVAGVSFPQGFALQRAWNSEQKKRAEKRKAVAVIERRKASILAQMAKLADELKQLDADLAKTTIQSIQIAQDEQLPDFDALDAELLRVQQSRELAEKMAHREQEQLFGGDNK